MRTAFSLTICLLLALTSCNEREKASKGPEAKEQSVLLKTVHGNLSITLRAASAPSTVTRFIELIKAGFYDGQIFHKVIPNKFIEAGGTTGSGKKMPLESNKLLPTFGAVIMRPTLNNSELTDSQFYIVISPSQNNLNGHDGVIFGFLEEGGEVAKSIQEGDKILSLSLNQREML